MLIHILIIHITHLDLSTLHKKTFLFVPSSTNPMLTLWRRIKYKVFAITMFVLYFKGFYTQKPRNDFATR